MPADVAPHGLAVMVLLILAGRAAAARRRGLAHRILRDSLVVHGSYRGLELRAVSSVHQLCRKRENSLLSLQLLDRSRMAWVRDVGSIDDWFAFQPRARICLIRANVHSMFNGLPCRIECILKSRRR